MVLMAADIMELSSGVRSIEQLPLPPGFRFNPTDEELVWHYLRRQADSESFEYRVIAEVDLYKFDPWDLPGKALFGEKEWFFFSPRDRKYPRGARPNRAAASGYWKATGTDKPIYVFNTSGRRMKVGVKKSLVFYLGRAPKGDKTNWIMHEYRLAEGVAPSAQLHRRGSQRLDDWVLCRIYKKHSSHAQRVAGQEHDVEPMSWSMFAEFEEQLRTDSAAQEEDVVDNVSTSETTTFPATMLNIPGAITSEVPSLQQTIASINTWNLQDTTASTSHQARFMQELAAASSQQTGPALNYIPQLQFRPQQSSSSYTAPGHYNACIMSPEGQRSSFSDEVEEVQSPFQYYAGNPEGALFPGFDHDLSTYPSPPGMDSFSYGQAPGPHIR